MRSKERLIEVLKSCNPAIASGWHLSQVGFRMAAGSDIECVDVCKMIIRLEPSSHYQELAREALHYLGETRK